MRTVEENKVIVAEHVFFVNWLMHFCWKFSHIFDVQNNTAGIEYGNFNFCTFHKLKIVYCMYIKSLKYKSDKYSNRK